MDRILELLAQDGVQELIVGLVALLYAGIMKLKWVQERNLEVALGALETGVAETWHSYVKGLKEYHADGKLTEAEKAEARRRAIDTAKAVAAQQGVDLLRYYGPRVAEMIVHKLANRSKTLGAIAAPLAESWPEPELGME